MRRAQKRVAASDARARSWAGRLLDANKAGSTHIGRLAMKRLRRLTLATDFTTGKK